MGENSERISTLLWDRTPYVLEGARLLLLAPAPGSPLYERLRMIDRVVGQLNVTTDTSHGPDTVCASISNHIAPSPLLSNDQK